jgi:hypothetical protein
MLHRPNTRVQDTMNEAFKWLGRFKPGAAKASITSAIVYAWETL